MTPKDKARQIIAEEIGTTIDDVEDDTSFQDDLEIDSLDRVTIVMALEDEFGVDLDDDEFQNAPTFGAAWAVLEKKL